MFAVIEHCLAVIGLLLWPPPATARTTSYTYAQSGRTYNARDWLGGDTYDKNGKPQNRGKGAKRPRTRVRLCAGCCW